jgi:integrase
VPAARKGVRLYLRRARRDADGSDRAAHWVIRDGRHEESTGCSAGDLGGAQTALETYLNTSRLAHTAAAGARAPSHIWIADVIALYSAQVVPNHARPKETAARLARIIAWWGDKRLAAVNGTNCRAYAAGRSSPAAARRELEELRAAINHHRQEGLCAEVVAVTLPERSGSRERWCTRSEVARLLWAAMTFREVQKGHPTGRRSRRHLAKFLLVALYTGTRAGAVCAAALEPIPGHGWIDVDRGIFYRRPAGARETKKRRPPVPLPDKLLRHLRRWKKNGQRFAVEFNGGPVKDVDKAFRRNAEAAKLPDVSPHVLRHTAATWLMQLGTDTWEAAEYLGMTPQTLINVYGHHHPDYLNGARAAFDRRDAKQGTKLGTDGSSARLSVGRSGRI